MNNVLITKIQVGILLFIGLVFIFILFVYVESPVLLFFTAIAISIVSVFIFIALLLSAAIANDPGYNKETIEIDTNTFDLTLDEGIEEYLEYIENELNG